jgi:hypothetical protein
MTRKDFTNVADALAALPMGEAALNQIIVSFSKKFEQEYENFNPKTFREYIIKSSKEQRRIRMKAPGDLSLKLIE